MRLAILCCATAVGLVVVASISQVAGGQQVFPANGLNIFAEAGMGAKGRTLLTVETSRGQLRSVSFAIVRDADAGILRGAAGRSAGELELNSAGPYRLLIPRRPGNGTVTLLQRGALRVVFSPTPSRRKNAVVLRVSGLPARTTHVDITLHGRGGPLITSKVCPSKPTLVGRAVRSGASSPATTRSGTQC
jgi:hypothetical protein